MTQLVVQAVLFDLDGTLVLNQSGQDDAFDCIPQPGALVALDELPTTRWAIVSSRSRALAVARIRAAGLPLPRHLVTADDVLSVEPDPALYLLAASRLKCEPASCLVVEDTPAGVASAKAAGMRVIGLRTTHPRLDAPCVDDLSQVEFSADRRGVIVTY